VYLPVNPVEYHGPHLPLHTDAILSEGLIRDVHARLAKLHPEWPLLVATNLEIGVEPVPGPGTRPVPYPLVRSLVVDACRALADLGARRVVLMTFHGSPLHNLALEAGVKALRSRGVFAMAPFHLLLREMLIVDRAALASLAPAVAHIQDRALRDEILQAIPLDFHAGFFETSMMLHYAPESVSPDHRSLAPCPKPSPKRALALVSRLLASLGQAELSADIALAANGLGWLGLDPFPGYTSHPALATREAGAIFAERIADRFADHAEAVLAGERAPPEPILPWISWASLGGRLSA
jgi:creatinine amidohydrolase